MEGFKLEMFFTLISIFLLTASVLWTVFTIRIYAKIKKPELILEKITEHFKPDRDGIYKKIHEVREIKEALEKLNADCWTTVWCDEQERWMSSLATEMEKLDSQIADYGVVGRQKYGL